MESLESRITRTANGVHLIVSESVDFRKSGSEEVEIYTISQEQWLHVSGRVIDDGITHSYDVPYTSKAEGAMRLAVLFMALGQCGNKEETIAGVLANWEKLSLYQSTSLYNLGNTRNGTQAWRAAILTGLLAYH